VSTVVTLKPITVTLADSHIALMNHHCLENNTRVNYSQLVRAAIEKAYSNESK